MKIKSLKAYLNCRLDADEINAIERAAEVEYESFISLQQDVAKAVRSYMTKNNVGFNDLVRKFGKSPTQVSKIIKGEANLTMATIGQLYVLMGKKARIVAK